MNLPSSPALQAFLEQCQQRVDNALTTHLSGEVHNERLSAAMQYATLKGGKRIRPVLAYASILAIGDELKHADTAACAVELIHCYSLVHDDLPAMDNDDLRRGVPTVHKAYDEATAILTGDALQSLAFQVIASSDADRISSNARLKMVAILSQAAGVQGMVAGQALDSAAVGRELELTQLEVMHSLKTGALIKASVQLGALSSPTITDEQFQALSHYAENIGLAFQIQDDILDVMGNTDTLGKPQGSDQSQNKPTYVSLLGLDAASAKAAELSERAVAALEPLTEGGDELRWLAQFIVKRVH
jgi:geranylgeranyl pyrophosphate synthase